MRTSPSRTCLGCRRVRPQAALIRLVRLTSGTVVVDAGRRGAGRGAYVCPDTQCIERGLSRGRLGHAFRKPSEAGPNLGAAVRAAARRVAPGAPLCEVSARAIEDADVDHGEIVVRS
ncbi:MAG: DUF448 domain-containing protein [Candidatus Rokuibacteriota bacterium]|nr:MAG: DUF448 domain-containing protein [Candidatus Rokubacteria bacterium]